MSCERARRSHGVLFWDIANDTSIYDLSGNTCQDLITCSALAMRIKPWREYADSTIESMLIDQKIMRTDHTLKGNYLKYQRFE